MTASQGQRAWLFPSLRGYRRAWLASDVVAALTLAAIVIPEQLATARLVGLAPITGLLTFAAGTAAFAVLGANRFMSAGADSTIAPIMASALAASAAVGSAHYAELAHVMALMVGVLLLASGLARLGWVADLLSIPVTTGFLAGISLHIILGQLPDLLGVAPATGDMLHQAAHLLRLLPDAHPYPASIGIGVLVLSLAAERWSARIPGAFIGFVGAGVAVWTLDLARRGTSVVGALPLEPLHVSVSAPGWQSIEQLFPASLIVALVCLMQTAAVVRSFPSHPGQEEEVSRDFAALGAGSLIAGLIGAFAVNSSPPRTAAVHVSGGRSQLSGLLAIALVAAVVILARRAFAVLPVSALSGVLIFIGLRIFRLSTMRRIYLKGGYEISLVAASAALVVLLPIQTGVTLSIVLSLTHSIYIVARPDCAVLSRVAGTTVWWKKPEDGPGEQQAGVLVFAPGAPVCFANAAYIRRALQSALAALPEPCRLLVIEANGVIDIDFTGSQMLQEVIAELRARDVAVALARLESERAQRAAARTGLTELLGPGRIFRSVSEAIAACSPGSPGSLSASA